MLKFECSYCNNLIEDVCGEHVDTDNDGNVISYECPHCGKTIKRVIRIVPLCRLPKNSNIIKRECDLANIVDHSSISWTEDSLKDGKIRYYYFYDDVKVKISRCKVVEIEYVPERTDDFLGYIKDGIITRSRDLKMIDLNKIYEKLGKKYDHLDKIYYQGSDYDNIITI